MPAFVVEGRRGARTCDEVCVVAFFLVIILRMRGFGRILIDPALGNRRQLLVRGLFFLERFLKQRRGLIVAHRLRPGDERAVRRHLVVFGALPGGYQARVHGRLVEVFLHDRLAFFDDAGNALAVLAARLLAERFEHLLQAFDLAAGLLEVRLEGIAEISRGGGLREFRQRLGQLFLGIVGVAKLVDKGIVQCCQIGHDSLLVNEMNSVK